jgi:hypothetical protein
MNFSSFGHKFKLKFQLYRNVTQFWINQVLLYAVLSNLLLPLLDLHTFHTQHCILKHNWSMFFTVRDQVSYLYRTTGKFKVLHTHYLHVYKPHLGF